MKPTEFSEMVKIVTDGAPPRVWSLIVTLFGDLVQPTAGQISGATLSRLLGLLGIKPEAIRVALHRLRKDGWIESHKTGRESLYRLSDWGATQTRDATPRIYHPHPVQDAWMILTDPALADPLPDTEVVWITPQMALTAICPDDAGSGLCLALDPAADLPDWIRRASCDAQVLAQCSVLADRFDALRKALAQTGALPCEQQMALRVLLVHAWRRLALRLPALPEYVLPQPFSGRLARQQFDDLLATLPRLPLAKLEELRHQT